MTQQIINLGAGPDSQTGDTIYVAFQKVNDNFTELYEVFENNTISSFTANTIFANNIVTTANVRSGNLFAYGNLETVGYIVTSGVFYPNGVPIGSAEFVSTDVIPEVSNIYSLGNVTRQFLSAYIGSNINLNGANIAVGSGQLLLNGVPVGNYSNANVTAFLPLYSGNLNSINRLSANSATFNGNVSINGDLNVDGNITYINVQNLRVVDPIIELNTGPNGSPLVANTTYDVGVKANYYDGSAKSAFFGRSNSSGYFEYYSNVTSESANVISGTLGTIRASNLLLTEQAFVNGNITAGLFVGNFSGNITGNITAAGADTQVMFNDNNITTGSPNFTFQKLTNTVSTGNLNIGSNVFIVNGQRVGVNTASFVDGAILQINSTDSILLPSGTSFERPANAQPGMLRFNTLLNDIEYYDGASWAQPVTQFTISVANAQPGTGSQTVFALPVANATTAGTIISINGIVQQPVTAYSITGNSVTFTEAPSPNDIIDFRIITTSSTLTGITDVYGTTGLFLDQIAPGDGLIQFKNSGVDSLLLQANGQANFTRNISASNASTGTITVEGGIGVKGNIHVAGTLYAFAKSFLIDHPCDKNKKLQYASLEGPENGVYVRGKLENSSSIDLPDYWKYLVDVDTITVNLTPNKQYQKLFVKKITENKILIGSEDNQKINCFYTIYAERKDIDKLQVEQQR